MVCEELTGKIIKAALRVHARLGPGLFEEVYKNCLKYELTKHNLKVISEVAFPVAYDEVLLDFGYRMDLLVESQVIVELKAVKRILPVHKAQLITYLKLSNREVGLLINFNVVSLKDGVKRLVNPKFYKARTALSHFNNGKLPENS